MKKLFLTAYFARTADLLPPFAGDCSGRRVCFIPTAAIPEAVDFYVDEGRAALEKLGMTVDILDVAAEPAAVIAAKLHHCDCIYVSGGNTFFLLQALHKKQAGEMLAAQISAGKLYIGESAGAVILAPSVDYMRAIDDAGAAEQTISTGLQILDIYPLPHYGEFPFAEATAEIIQNYGRKLAICPINNGQVILVSGQQFVVKSIINAHS
ncbi:Type 1 glutamine amidotransferase-like domain-containing protein [Uruburuella testudinis]|uniref:Type 1 glutamine amidotransferase-like domain-containing protein n=1 Tax=Uruburuella testudinis TaxID=1282863 RepID=A0ABY4DSL8_9NEIS|nr:Type 1 glutamine amidotransferase-like domain-containing protein [Uruburuella testudinis]UOO81866.1 Type 1 glutamine amidotransferase-like domain-containing protein [Uruburuella testudinis]